MYVQETHDIGYFKLKFMNSMPMKSLVSLSSTYYRLDLSKISSINIVKEKNFVRRVNCRKEKESLTFTEEKEKKLISILFYCLDNPKLDAWTSTSSGT